MAWSRSGRTVLVNNHITQAATKAVGRRPSSRLSPPAGQPAKILWQPMIADHWYAVVAKPFRPAYVACGDPHRSQYLIEELRIQWVIGHTPRAKQTFEQVAPAARRLGNESGRSALTVSLSK